MVYCSSQICKVSFDLILFVSLAVLVLVLLLCVAIALPQHYYRVLVAVALCSPSITLCGLLGSKHQLTN